MSVINSPFAVVSGNSVRCKLCNVSVKSVKVWTAHVNGKQHRECLLRPKRSGNLGNGSSGSKIHVSDGGNTKKRQIPDSGEHVVKRLKENIPKDFFETLDKASKSTFVQPKTSNVAKSSESDTSISVHQQTAIRTTTIQIEEIIDHNSDGFNEPSTSSSALPEGFFDDKKLDAKARNVEVADKFEDEWKKFQKELVQEQHVADAIVDDEDIRLHSEREIEEVQNEMGDLAKFVELEKLEATRRVAGQIKQEISDEEMSDENDDTLNFDELNSWRAKKF